MLEPVIPHLKALHISFLAFWIAGLAALPVMLARQEAGAGQADVARIRQATHLGYIWLVTPAAVLTVITGTSLIFLREVFTGWMLAKLLGVAGLVMLHTWIGHGILSRAEAGAETTIPQSPPRPAWPLGLLAGLVLGVLALVLAKPDLDTLPLPAWLLHPLGRDLPFDVPSP